MEIPDVIEPIVGWRLWMLKGESLCGPIFPGRIWQGVMEAECDNKFKQGLQCSGSPCTLDEVPTHSGHGCGLYAWKTYDLLRNDPTTIGPGSKWSMVRWVGNEMIMNATFVVGEVSLWGNVYEYESGWRAQFAAIRALYVDVLGREPRDMTNLQEQYDVPIISMKEHKWPR